ncbi:MAG TPA: hypothetical protein ENN74_00710 [Firmicutes bacterium]|nr:hypothetical protein [Bacillota bacterium]
MQAKTLRIFQWTPSRARAVPLSACLLLVLLLSACSHTPKRTGECRVIPIQSREAQTLSAREIAGLLIWSGFDANETLELGVDLRNALAFYGGAQVMMNRKTEALFAIHKPYVHVSSKRRGSFIYHLEPPTQEGLEGRSESGALKNTDDSGAEKTEEP